MRLLILSALVVLSGCTASRAPVVSYQCPQLVLPANPVAPVKKLTNKSTPDEVMKTWVATAVAYRNWNRIVRVQNAASQSSK